MMLMMVWSRDSRWVIFEVLIAQCPRFQELSFTISTYSFGTNFRMHVNLMRCGEFSYHFSLIMALSLMHGYLDCHYCMKWKGGGV